MKLPILTAYSIVIYGDLPDTYNSADRSSVLTPDFLPPIKTVRAHTVNTTIVAESGTSCCQSCAHADRQARAQPSTDADCAQCSASCNKRSTRARLARCTGAPST